MGVRAKSSKDVKKHSGLSVWFFVFCSLVISLSAAAAIVVYAQQRRVTITRPAGKNVVIKVSAGGDVQQALNIAQSGDTIELQAGASYIGALTLPYKNGNEFITVQSSGAARLPEGRRVEATDAAHMAKILSPGKAAPTVTAAPRAHHYRFVGIEFAPSNADIIYNLIDFGSDAEKLADVPHHLEIDRSYLHPFAKGGKVRRGLALNSADTIVKNSYFQGFAFAGEETQAICGWSGTKNVQILNNKLEGGGENIMFGGSDPKSAELVPSDILIQGNWLYKPTEWDPSSVVLKALFEIKNAKRLQMIGNVLENAPQGELMRLTVRNQDGSAPFSTIEDVLIKNNVFISGTNGTQILGKDDIHPSQIMKRVKIINNLFLDVESYFIRVAGGDDVEIAHNTIFHRGNMVTVYGAASRFVMRDNIFGYNEYGFTGDNVGVGARALTKYFPGGVIRNNAIINNNNLPGGEFTIPGGNFEIKGFNAVGFANLTGKNYRLSPNSRLKGKATNAADVGANFDELLSVLPRDLHNRIQ